MSVSGINAVKRQSPYQFALFRWLFGLYLAIHCAQLIPWAGELFSSRGVLPDPSVSPLHGLFPNLLTVVDSPLAIQSFLALLGVTALIFAAGYIRPAAAVLLWYGWTCLFGRNLLISNPGLPYVGLTLLLCALVPAGEGLKPGALRADKGWAMPFWLWSAAFYALMVGYSYSGLMKLSALSWLNGEAMGMLLSNPLARDSFVRDWLLLLPAPLLNALTWIALMGEIVALPLCLFRRGRFIAWSWMLVMHLGIVLMVNFTDLTLGMILVHLFVFDPQWLPARAPNMRRVVFFDGVCVLCNDSMRFLIDEDHGGILRFAPLEGETAASEPAIVEMLERDAGELRTVVYVRGEGDEKQVLSRSDAILAILHDLGGFWRLLAAVRWLPRALRDRAYDFVGSHRYRWFGRLDVCRLPRAEEEGLFLD